MGYGAMRLPGKDVWGEPDDPARARSVLRRAVELGINFIDTAWYYGPLVANRLIAEALHPYPRDLGDRHEARRQAPAGQGLGARAPPRGAAKGRRGGSAHAPPRAPRRRAPALHARRRRPAHGVARRAARDAGRGQDPSPGAQQRQRPRARAGARAHAHRRRAEHVQRLGRRRRDRQAHPRRGRRPRRRARALHPQGHRLPAVLPARRRQRRATTSPSSPRSPTSTAPRPRRSRSPGCSRARPSCCRSRAPARSSTSRRTGTRAASRSRPTRSPRSRSRSADARAHSFRYAAASDPARAAPWICARRRRLCLRRHPRLVRPMPLERFALGSVAFVLRWLDWSYLATVGAFVVLCIWLAFGRHGKRRLGDEPPEFSRFVVGDVVRRRHGLGPDVLGRRRADHPLRHASGRRTTVHRRRSTCARAQRLPPGACTRGRSTASPRSCSPGVAFATAPTTSPAHRCASRFAGAGSSRWRASPT